MRCFWKNNDSVEVNMMFSSLKFQSFLVKHIVYVVWSFNLSSLNILYMLSEVSIFLGQTYCICCLKFQSFFVKHIVYVVWSFNLSWSNILYMLSEVSVFLGQTYGICCFELDGYNMITYLWIRNLTLSCLC